jgi:hypothetical protein
LFRIFNPSHDRYFFSRARSWDFWPGLGHSAKQASGTLGTTTQNIDQKLTQDNFQSRIDLLGVTTRGP